MSLTIQKRDQLFGYFLTLPGLATLLIIVVFPIIFTIITSFYDYTLLNPHHDSFVGLDNYQEVIEEDYIGHSFLITSQFVLLTVLIEFIVGFIIALSLNKVKRLKTIYYVILLAPLMINPVVVGLIWRMILHTELGIFNYLLKLLDINRVNWLGDNDNAFWTIIFVDIWHQVSFMTILLLAGLSSLPQEPYEAARMDGASSLRCLISITFPLMRPVITVAILLRLIFSIKTFDIIYIMTKGGPGISTDLISYFIYRSAFFGLDIGRASALSVGLLIIVLFLTFFLYKYMRSLN